MYCTACGNEVRPDGSCTSCGTSPQLSGSVRQALKALLDNATIVVKPGNYGGRHCYLLFDRVDTQIGTVTADSDAFVLFRWYRGLVRFHVKILDAAGREAFSMRRRKILRQRIEVVGDTGHLFGTIVRKGGFSRGLKVVDGAAKHVGTLKNKSRFAEFEFIGADEQEKALVLVEWRGMGGFRKATSSIHFAPNLEDGPLKSLIVASVICVDILFGSGGS